MSRRKDASTGPTVSSAKNTTGTLLQCGQEALRVRGQIEVVAELSKLRSEVARLKQDILTAEAENDRLVTENLTIKSARSLAHRELYDAVHKALTQHAPGRYNLGTETGNDSGGVDRGTDGVRPGH